MRPKLPSWVIGFLATLVLLAACREDRHATTHAREPWIFRINLDNMPRMLVVALNKELWAAYDVQNARLYKTWKGGISFNGPMYDDRHNVQPSTSGVAYTIDSLQQSPWSIREKGIEKKVKPEYLGYTLKQDAGTIQYRIPIANGHDILINETPGYTSGKEDSPVFVRVFETTHVPDGIEVLLHTKAGSLHSAEDIEVKGGKFQRTELELQETEKGNKYYTEGDIILKNNGLTEIKVSHTSGVTRKINTTPIGSQPSSIEIAKTIVKDERGSGESDGQRLIGLNDCAACHNINTKGIGPSYSMIAAKYDRNSDAIDRLADKVITGGTGVWGRQSMTPHPQLSKDDAASMISYILSLDSGSAQKLRRGLAANFYKSGTQLSRVPDLIPGQRPNLSVVVPDIELVGIDMSINKESNDFFGFDDQFVMHLSGFLNVAEGGKYEFRLKANAGASFILNGKKVADVNYSNYDYQEQEVSAELKRGANAIRIEYYEDIYSSNLNLRWRRPGEKEFRKIPEEAFTYDTADIMPSSPGLKEIYEVNAPGYGRTVDSVHPSFGIETVRPEGFNKRLSDLEFLPDGSLAVATWDSTGSIYIIEGVMGNDRKKMKAHLFASGLYEVMGLEYVDGKLYALQKWELTELTDTDGDNVADQYRAVLDDWTASANFHEWAFGLIYKDGYFYFNTGIALGGNGIITDAGIKYIKRIQTKDRGKTLKVRKKDWTYQPIAHGYKAPNGIGFGVDGEIFSTDNEGHMVPTNKLMHVVQTGYPFFGNDEVLKELSLPVPKLKPPVLWMPETEVSNSPSQPVVFKMGPFREGQMVFGDIHHGGLQRVFVEKVNGEYQGAIFRFTQGLESGINRLAWGPDGNLYMAGLGAGGDFGHQGQCCGLQRLVYNSNSSMDMVSVRAKANGMEIEFTEPLRIGDGEYISDYSIQQFWYETADDVMEGGVKNDIENLELKSVNVSGDRTKVFLEINGMKKEHVVYIKINKPFLSSDGHRLWAGETWYTLNNIPAVKGEPGDAKVKTDNQLSDEERDDGWKLLFNDNTMNQWGIPFGGNKDKWKMSDHSLTGSGKDGVLFSRNQFSNFELEFEWKVSEGGDGGVFINVPAGQSYKQLSDIYPEFQLIDDVNNPDAIADATHLSGAAYKMVAPKYKLSDPHKFNHSRIVAEDDHVEYWLNGTKVTEYDPLTDSWQYQWKSIFGDDVEPPTQNKGHIALVVQEGTINFKNIRIRQQ